MFSVRCFLIYERHWFERHEERKLVYVYFKIFHFHNLCLTEHFEDEAALIKEKDNNNNNNNNNNNRSEIWQRSLIPWICFIKQQIYITASKFFEIFLSTIKVTLLVFVKQVHNFFLDTRKYISLCGGWWLLWCVSTYLLRW